MRFTDQQIDEFRRILETETGELISLAEAQEEASHLMDLMLLISRELPSEREARLAQAAHDATLPPS